MAKQESTAVNALIESMQRKTLARDEEAFRTQRGLSSVTRTPAAPVPQVGPPLGTMTTRGLGSPRPAVRTTKTPASMPVAAPFESASMRLPPVAAPVTLASTVSQEWFASGDHEQSWIGTLRVQQRKRWMTAGKLVASLILLATIGVFVGGYLVFDSRGSKAPVAAAAVPTPPAPASAAVADEPAPVKAAVVAEPAPAPVRAAAPAAAPSASKFVDVMVVSTPAGATVTLVDRGKTTFIGTTPIALALEPSRKVELVFSYADRPTQIEALDPATTRRMDVTLGARPAAPAPAPPAAVAPPPKPALVAPAPVRRRAPAVRAAAVAAGEGTLMITSKPPCEIIIDGKPTGLTTPQRAIALSAGPHQITLVNEDEDIRKQISVRIRADQATKVIENLMESE